jgi:hypothetical protein
MSPQRFLPQTPGRVRLVRTIAPLLVLLLSNPLSAQDHLPAPKDAFSADAALIVYADLETASRSGIWKTLEARLAPLAGQLGAVPGMPTPMPGQLQGLPGVESEDVAELAIVIAGKNALQNLESGQFDRDFAFRVVGRLTRSVETDVFVSQILDAIETEQPGSRAQLEATRSRVGAAEYFELPPELLGPAAVPFPVGAAVGQGRDGTVFGFGKDDSLRAFITGQVDGALPAGIASSLARRGQVWIYLPLHADMTRFFSDGAGMDNPMVDGFAQGLDKVQEFGMGFTFGSSAIDFELVLGCADNAAARELTQTVQQFIGLMGMVSAQNPGSTPPVLGKLRAASDGSLFRLTGALTSRDFDLALEGISPGAATGPRRSTGAAALPPIERREPPPIPVSIEVLELLPGDLQSLRHTRVRIDNHSSLAVRDIRLTFQYLDHTGRRVGQWTRRHVDPTLDTLVAAGISREIRCPVFHVPSTTRRVTATLHEVTFVDGTKWTAGR